MRPKLPPRVVGIYADRGSFRVVYSEHGKRKSLILPTREAAEQTAQEIAARFKNVTQPLLSAAIAEWTAHRLQSGSCKPETAHEQAARLRFFLSSYLEKDICELTPARAEVLYQQAIQRATEKTGAPMTAATHRFYLSVSRSFYGWAKERNYIHANPFAGVVPVGQVRVGKPQLKLDEAQRFLDSSLRYFDESRHPLALGACIALVMGTRTSEVLGRRVQDVEEDARFLYVGSSNPARPPRRLEVPTVLRSRLRELTLDKAPEVLLFGCARNGKPWSRQSLHAMVRRLCSLAGVPAVCTHSLRGLCATLGTQARVDTHAVAARLGHASPEQSAELLLASLHPATIAQLKVLLKDA